MKALEFRLSSEFGMFRRPEKQKPALTFGIIPKSAVFGVCGAIIGLEGYRMPKSVPDFWDKLQHLKVAVALSWPDGTSKRPFGKTFVKYLNYHGYGNVDGPDIIQEQILINPSFVITIFGDDNDIQFSSIKKHLKEGSCVFRPYLGKNEFLANVEFLRVTNIKEFDGEMVSCSTIYAENLNYMPGKATPARLWSYLIRDDFSMGLDNYGRHLPVKVCQHDGEITPTQADLSVGKFYQLDDGKIVFAF